MEKGKSYKVRFEYYENAVIAVVSLGWEYLKEGEDEIKKSVTAAQNADVVVYVGTINEGEGCDRSNMNLPGSQEEVIKALSKTGKPMAVVLMAGAPVTMENWIHCVPAIVDVWYPGEEGGNAVADVLFGDYNPGGKIPVTFPISASQEPIYYNSKPTGRRYDYGDLTGSPRFAFGYGLSYTTFKYGDLNFSKDIIKSDEPLTVSFTLKNTGKVEGDEVAQLYIHDKYASVARPLKELKRFKRVSLKAGEEKNIEFTILPEDIKMYDADMNWIVEPGEFEVMIGSSSSDIRLSKVFTVIK